MTVIAGADGCRAGWICVQMNTAARQVTAALYPTAAALLAAARGLDVLCIDIPIGLAEDGPRLCDMAARKILGPPRASSVFPAPVRAALSAGTWEEACARAEAATGKRLSLQSYAILHRIRAVDALLRASPALQQVCHEVHPEVSFHYWNGGRALRSRRREEPAYPARRSWERAVPPPTSSGGSVPASPILGTIAALSHQRGLRGDVCLATPVAWSLPEALETLRQGWLAGAAVFIPVAVLAAVLIHLAKSERQVRAIT